MYGINYVTLGFLVIVVGVAVTVGFFVTSEIVEIFSESFVFHPIQCS